MSFIICPMIISLNVWIICIYLLLCMLLQYVIKIIQFLQDRLTARERRRLKKSQESSTETGMCCHIKLLY